MVKRIWSVYWFLKFVTWHVVSPCFRTRSGPAGCMPGFHHWECFMYLSFFVLNTLSSWYPDRLTGPSPCPCSLLCVVLFSDQQRFFLKFMIPVKSFWLSLLNVLSGIAEKGCQKKHDSLLHIVQSLINLFYGQKKKIIFIKCLYKE